MDIGLGSGAVARALKEEKAARIIGYDFIIDENAAQYCVDTYTVNLDYDVLPIPQGEHIDYILLLDVLEHLSNPEAFITSMRERLSAHNTTFLISTANIGFILMRLSLLFGRFNYGKRGILDLTHKRLFTFHSLNKMLVQRGFLVESLEGIPVPFELIFGDTWFSRLCLRCNNLLIRISRSLFSFQMVMKVRPQPTLQHLLAIAEKH